MITEKKRSRIFAIFLLVCFLIFPAQVVQAQQNEIGPQQHAEVIASLVAKPIFELDPEQIRTVVQNYFANVPELYGVKVFENLENEELLSVHRNDQDQLIFDGRFPEEISSLVVYEAVVVFRGQVIGEVDLFFNLVSEIGLTREEQNWIKQNPQIIIGIEEWYPFIRPTDQGGIEGIVADFLKIVLQKTGLQAKYHLDVWSNLLADFKQGRIDLLPATYFTEERTSFGLYSPQYFAGREFIYIRSDNLEVRSFEDLKGKKLAIPKDFGSIPKIKARFPDIEIVETKSQLDSINQVLNGRVDATFEQQIVMEQLLREELISGMRAVPQNDFEASKLYYFSNADKPLLNSILSKALESISEQERRQIITKWLIEGDNLLAAQIQNQPGEEIEDKTVLIMTLLVGVGLFLLLFILIVFLGRSRTNKDLSELFGSRTFRFTILFVLSFLVAIVCVMNWMAITEKRETTADKVNRELQIVLNISIDRIGAWLSERKLSLSQLGRDQELVTLVKEIINSETIKDPLAKQALVDQTKKFILDNLPVQSDDFYVVSTTHKNLLSHNGLDFNAHKILSQIHKDPLNRAFNGQVVFLAPISSKALDEWDNQSSRLNTGNMFFAAPIMDMDENVIALLVKRTRAEGDLSANLRLSRVGNSGETYAVSSEGKMLTESRFKDDIIDLGFQQNSHDELLDIDVRDPGGNLTEGFVRTQAITERPFTVMMADVLRLNKEGLAHQLETAKVLENLVHPGNVQGYPDYRGVQVVGAWTWLSELGFGLTSELDYAEAYEDYFSFRYNLILISAVATVLAIGATLFTLILGQRSHKALVLARDNLEDRVLERTQELKESETRSRSIIDNAADAIIVINQEGIVQTFSPAAELIFGYGAEEVIGQNVALLMPAHIAQNHDHYLQRYQEYGEQEIIGTSRETVGKRKNGEEFPLDLAVAEMIVGEEKLFTGIIRDISERKESESKLRDAYEVISGSITYASHIQQSVLPDMTPLASVLHDHFVIWEPRDVVGGDVYWCDFWGDGIHLTLADCTGHGVPGAFVTLLATGAFKEAKNEVFSGDLQAVITRFHKNLQFTLGQHSKHGTTDDGLELGSCYIDPEMTKMFFVGARFDLFIVENGQVEIIKGTKKGLGYRKVPADQYYQSHEIALVSGRRFYMTSDGLIDQVGGPRRRGFGKKRFGELLLKIQHLPMSGQKEAILDALRTYQGDELRRDDVSLIGFEVTASEDTVHSYHI